ncbi:MAG: DUF3035 domain-containing protein [Pseudomonadota bacterium]
MRYPILVFGVLFAISGCGGSDEPKLLNITPSRGAGPDEFAVLPTKPLEIPQNLASLPPPTPGAGNRTDQTPQLDAIAALGGNPAALSRASTDGALVAYSRRFGVDPNIRAELAADDLEFRRRNDGRPLERLFDVNVYFRAYESMSLDQYRELERLRRAGIRTSAVPPDPALEQ